MDSSLFKFFLFAIIVQGYQSVAEASKNNPNSSPTPLTNIIKEQQAESDLEKYQKQQQQKQQGGAQSFLDKLITSTSRVSESEVKKSTSKGSATGDHGRNSKMTPKNEATQLQINEATTANEVR
jgi:hypothetical protein